MQWSDVFLELVAREQERALMTDVPLHTSPASHHHDAPARGWRRVLWSAGHALEALGRRVEEIAAAHGQA